MEDKKELIPVGLDIGTGFVKASVGTLAANGDQKHNGINSSSNSSSRTVTFPSLIGRIMSDVENGRKKRPGDIAYRAKRELVEQVGESAVAVASNRYGTIIRPVDRGLPHDDAGFGRLASEAMSRLGINDTSRTYVVLGIPHDPNGDAKTERASIDRIARNIKKSVNPYGVKITAQAYGTLKSCGRREGTVINIGHGTTEIISVAPSGYPDGFSIDRASAFVTSQLGSGRRRRESYVYHKKLFEENPAETARLVRLLAAHIADDVARIDIVEPVILAGGGSLIPGMREEFEKILKRQVTIPENPVYANAIGYEMIARDVCARIISSKRPQTAEEVHQRTDMHPKPPLSTKGSS